MFEEKIVIHVAADRERPDKGCGCFCQYSLLRYSGARQPHLPNRSIDMMALPVEAEIEGVASEYENDQDLEETEVTFWLNSCPCLNGQQAGLGDVSG